MGLNGPSLNSNDLPSEFGSQYNNVGIEMPYHVTAASSSIKIGEE